jgi:predicted regulator of Ras-like GTPase activity (Roadblock/LC7/MglB family)
MEAAQALADLTEISSQIEGAVLADAEGSVVASTFSDDESSAAVAKAAAELLAAAEEERGDSSQPLIQLQAAFAEASVFVVRDGAHFVVAVTGAEPTVGLVFYDLKTCLRLLGEDEAAKKPARRRRKTGTEESASGEA